MLVLSRYPEERIELSFGNTLITLTVVEIDLKRGKVRIGIDAPQSVDITRPDSKCHQKRGVVSANRP